MTVHSPDMARPTYLDIQAAIGITKHIGGRAASNELLALCHVAEAALVLEIGCGVGAGPVNMAQQHGCRIVAMDVSPRMIAWARQRAEVAGVADRIIFLVGDVMQLPLAADSFEAVICESVLTFVPDKAAAIAEMVRVTRPDGWVGLNEGWLADSVQPELAARSAAALGADVPTIAGWQALWDATGLREQQTSFRPVDAGAETRSRIEWIGWRWLLPAWGRALRLIATRPAARRAIREQFDAPLELMNQFGYGLLVGRK